MTDLTRRDDTDEAEGRKAIEFVMAEMDAQWAVALAAYFAPRDEFNYMTSGKLERLAAQRIMIFGGVDWTKAVMAGPTTRPCLNDLAALGHAIPSEIETVRGDWYLGIVNYDLSRHYSERTTPEGRRAARAERAAAEAAYKERQKRIRAAARKAKRDGDGRSDFEKATGIRQTRRS